MSSKPPYADARSRRAFVKAVPWAAWAALGLTACASTPPAKSARTDRSDKPDSKRPLEAAQPEPSRVDAAVEYAAVNRLTWGANSSTMQRVHALGYGRWLTDQLNAPPALLPQAVQQQIDALRISTVPVEQLVTEVQALRKQADAAASDADKQALHAAFQKAQQQLAHEAMKRQVLRALYSPNQLQEHLTWFWFNHFNVHMHKDHIRVLVGDYEDRAIRPHVLGRFRELLGATLRHPAMLLYLDNAHNAVGHINENYARELLELHTLGVDAGYTQRDVQELARVLTGVGIRPRDGPPPGLGRPGKRVEHAELYRSWGLVEFRPERHDFGDKTVLGQHIAAQGWAEVEQVLDMLARHPACARLVCRKLAGSFIGDNPPQGLIDRMVQAWSRSDGHLAVVMRALAESPECRAPLSASASTGKFKDPVHYVLSAVRLAYDDKPILNPMPIINWLNRMGEGLYNHQTPDGYPQAEAAWTGAGQMNTRFEIARALGGGSAGLFRAEQPEGAASPAVPPERAAFPQLANALYYQSIEPTLRPATRQALDQARTPQEWNAYLLSSPDFMYR